MIKSILTAIAFVTVASSASAFEICSPTLDTDVSVKNSDSYGVVPEASIGFKFVIGKANCDAVRAEANQAQADARKAEAEAHNEALETVKLEAETEEQTIDNMLKLIKAYDALAELCEDSGNANICEKADKLSIQINNL